MIRHWYVEQLCIQALLCSFILSGAALADAQGPPISSTSSASYSLLDVLTKSAFEENKAPFTPLSVFNFGEGWLEPWIPPPNGELHLQRGGWVNTDSGFLAVNLTRPLRTMREHQDPVM